MNVYIWEYVCGATSSYHDGGGIVIIAESLDAAREMMRDNTYIQLNCDAYTTDPDQTFKIYKYTKPYIKVFPDSGCC